MLLCIRCSWFSPRLILILLFKDSAGTRLWPQWCFQHQCDFRVCDSGGVGGGSGSFCWGAAGVPLARDLCTTGWWLSCSCAQQRVATAVLLPSYVILQAGPTFSPLRFSWQIWCVALSWTSQQQWGPPAAKSRTQTAKCNLSQNSTQSHGFWVWHVDVGAAWLVWILMGIFSDFLGQGIPTLTIDCWASSRALLYFSQAAWACFRYNNADGVFCSRHCVFESHRMLCPLLFRVSNRHTVYSYH